jgi:hypothetical protein
MSIKIPFMRKKISALLALSIAILMLMATSPVLLPLSNFLLQPVQAQTTLSPRTTQPAIGTLCTGPKDGAALTFNAQGTFSDPQHARITSGTFQVTNSSSEQIMYSGLIRGGSFTNNTSGGVILIAGIPNHFPNTPHSCAAIGDALSITTSCSTRDFNSIDITGSTVDNFGDFTGAVECSKGGGNTASSMTGSTQDSDGDGDGIPDSSDKCPNNSHHRCFKEGDTSTTTTTTTHEQQPSSPSSSSSNRTGNQTR